MKAAPFFARASLTGDVRKVQCPPTATSSSPAAPSVAVGQQFGEWTVLGKASTSYNGTYWTCRCSCGAERRVRGNQLRSGKSLSCGHVARSRRPRMAPTPDDRIAELGGHLREVGLWGTLEAIAAAYNVTANDILGDARGSQSTRARRAFMASLYGRGFSLPEVGRLVGRDHTTVLEGLKVLGVERRPKPGTQKAAPAAPGEAA